MNGSGKWHLAPMEETSAAGPHHNWPLQKGFDRFYGFLRGETDQFHPELTHDNHHIDPPHRPSTGGNPGVPPWDQLTEKQQRFACRLQEAFAAMLEQPGSDLRGITS